MPKYLLRQLLSREKEAEGGAWFDSCFFGLTDRDQKRKMWPEAEVNSNSEDSLIAGMEASEANR